MSRLLKPTTLVVVACIINFAVMALFVGGPGASGTSGAVDNGDVNGDRAIDIADAVYMLQHLFSGGPPPVAIAAGPTCPACDFTQAEVDLLKDIAANHLSIEMLDDGQGGLRKTVRLTGVNLQVVNGLGATNGNPTDPEFDQFGTQVNGLGNLIVGYNEDTFQTPNRTGSHCIVVGLGSSYTSFGGFVAGRDNTVGGPYASVSGGLGNTASGVASSVSGGDHNTASWQTSSVSGGGNNVADGFSASVSGGRFNTASGVVSSVSGGDNNTANANFSSVSGGVNNMANANFASVSGGTNNTASGPNSAVSGGTNNTASGTNSSVTGGQLNLAGGSESSVSGGLSNSSSGIQSSVSGGQLNVAGGQQSSVSGGLSRNSSGLLDWRAGGLFQDN